MSVTKNISFLKAISLLPNILTIGRIVLVPLVVGALFFKSDAWRWIAFILFCLAGITDLFDGWAARKFGAVTPFGRMLDPIADKLIVSAALLMLVANGTISGLALIPALIILGREILVSGLREFLAHAAVSLPVTQISKAKTVVQIVAIAALILAPVEEEWMPGITSVAIFGLWAAAALTLYTGFIYLQVGLAHVRSEKKARSSGKRSA